MDENEAARDHELARHRDLLGDRAYLALRYLRRPNDILRLTRLTEMGRAAGVETVAIGDVLYHVPDRRILQDVVTCIREGCSIDAAGFRRERSVDQAMKAPADVCLKDMHQEVAMHSRYAGSSIASWLPGP